MHRSEVLLATLGAAEGRPFSPVQLQKAIFLIDRNLSQIFDEGSRFSFEPYDYGPFDREVYAEATKLEMQGMASVTRGANGYSEYGATDAGLLHAREKLGQMQATQRDYIKVVADWVRAMSFAKLVKSIYAEYPEMRENSIFRG